MLAVGVGGVVWTFFLYNFGLSKCNRVNTVLLCLCNEKSVRNQEFIGLDLGHVQTVLSWMCIIIKIQYAFWQLLLKFLCALAAPNVLSDSWL